jgi:hypothetical protein
MKTTYHIPTSHHRASPKRGDLVHTNIGSKRERTWFILAVREVQERICPEMGGVLTRRYKIWAERWWTLDPETRVRLYRSATRAGGQHVYQFERFPAKRKKRTFEQLMRPR